MSSGDRGPSDADVKRRRTASGASQRSLHNAPIFRLLLKVAVNGTHQCDSIEFLRDRKIPTNTKVGAGDKNAASCNCMRASDTFLTQCSRVSTFDGAMIALGTARISCFEILLCQAELCQTLCHSRLFLNTSSRIPFGDHPLKLERYREDWHGPSVGMTRTNREA